MGASMESIHVLHIDDEPDFVELAAEFLERADERIEVESIVEAENALKLLESTEFDCIVSDYDMPTLNGIELLEAIRVDHPDIPFILFTGKGSEEVASEAISAGVTDYLQKTGDTHQYTVLANRIRNAVAGHQSARQAARRGHRMEQILKTVPACVVQIGYDGQFLFANDRAEEVLGLEPGDVPDRTYNDPAWNITDLDGNPIPDEELPFRQVRDTGEPLYGFRHTIEWPDGTRKVLRVNGAPLFDEDGNVESTIFALSDVTDRIDRERELNQYRTLVETVGDPMYILDPDGYIAMANEAMIEYLDADEETVVGERIGRFMAEGDLERGRDLLAELRSDPDRKSATFEMTAVTLADDRIPAETNIAIVTDEDGEFRGSVGVVRDITQRREHEAKLDGLREMTHRLMYTETKEETAELAVKAANDIIGAPLSGCHLVGSSEDMLEPVAVADDVDTTFGDAPSYHRDAPAGSRAALVWQAYDSNEPIRIDDTQAYEGLEEETPARSVLIEPLDSHGTFVVSSVNPYEFDQTDQLLVEMLATSLTTALDRLSRERSLQEWGNDLAHQNRRLEKFANALSHDLRNPLNVAKGRLDLASEECDIEHLEGIDRSLDRMEELIENVLSLARAGEVVQEAGTTELARLARACWDNVETGSARLDIDTDRSIQADPSRLQQLLENLFRNAVGHAGDSASITVGDLPDGFYVEDDGPGIPESDRDDVFDAGYSTTEQGTGFGLSIVQEIAEAHGWTIEVTAGSEGGARFELTGVEHHTESP